MTYDTGEAMIHLPDNQKALQWTGDNHMEMAEFLSGYCLVAMDSHMDTFEFRNSGGGFSWVPVRPTEYVIIRTEPSVLVVRQPAGRFENLNFPAGHVAVKTVTQSVAHALMDAEIAVDDTVDRIVVSKTLTEGLEAKPSDTAFTPVHSRTEGLKLLQHTPMSSTSPNSRTFYAWGERHVFFLCEYDGDVQVNVVPREPVSCTPKHNGRHYPNENSN